MQNVHLLIGCGGTGIQTLARTVELMSQDAMWRTSMWRNVYFVLVDTDSKDVNDFEESLSVYLRGVPEKPHIERLMLANEISILQPWVEKYLRINARTDEEKQARATLLEHWWHRSPEAPYFAQHIRNMPEGAGQCPPASFFATWMRLREYERKLERLYDQMQINLTGLGDWKVLNTVIVSGLAGGTGRGSWELIGFKTRDFFLKKGREISPHAFLVDQSAFKNVMDGEPQLALPMKINSLTGVSQLTCWVNNQKSGSVDPVKAKEYRLPSLKSPNNPDSDLINLNLRQDVNACGPATTAFLVFRDNGQTHLGDSDQYFDMIGAGIYAALSKSAIQSDRINHHASYYSLATATAEVAVSQIRQYFSAEARLYLINRITSINPRSLDTFVSTFKEQSRLDTRIATSKRKAFLPKKDGSFLQQVIREMLDEGTGRELHDKLTNQFTEDEDPELVRNAVTNYSREDAKLVRAAVQRALATTKGSPVELAETMCDEIIDKTQSLADVDSFLDRVIAWMETEEELLDMDSSQLNSKPVNIEQAVERFAGRQFLVVGERFNEQERMQLVEIARKGMFHNNFHHLVKEIRKVYKSWRLGLQRLKTGVDVTLHSMNHLRAEFEDDRDQSASSVRGATAFDLLFTSEKEPEKTTVNLTSARRFYRRDIKPVMSHEKSERLLKDIVEAKAPVLKVLRHAFESREFTDDYAQGPVSAGRTGQPAGRHR